MRGTLTFDLPEEHHEWLTAVHATDLAIVVWEIDQWLRTQTKYAPDDASEDRLNALDEARAKLWDFIEEHHCAGVME